MTAKAKPAKSVTRATKAKAKTTNADQVEPVMPADTNTHADQGRVERIAILAMQLNGGTQSRVSVNEQAIDEYAEHMAHGVQLPHPVVFFDGTDYWPADGFHRIYAAEKCQWETIECLIFDGTRDEAILYAAGANADHGLQRTKEDKEQAIRMVLANADWYLKSDRWIADHCRVSNHMVAKIRADYDAKAVAATEANGMPETADMPAAPKSPAMRKGKDGKLYPAPTPTPVAMPSGAAGDGGYVIRDGLGQPATDTNRESYLSVPRFKEAIDAIKTATRIINSLDAEKHGVYLPQTRIQQSLRTARDAILASVPFANCPKCDGHGCRDCQESGFITNAVYDQLPCVAGGVE